MSQVCYSTEIQTSFTFPSTRDTTRDPAFSSEVLPLRREISVKETNRARGAPTLQAMAARQALDMYDSNQLSQLPPVMLACMTKQMWSTIRALSADANRWRLMRRRACLLDRRMLDGPYLVPEFESKLAVTDKEEGMRPGERLSLAMDEILGKWDAIPHTEDLEGPDEKKEDVFDSANFYVDGGSVHKVLDNTLKPGQRRWEKEISAQLLLYRLMYLFQQAPTMGSGAWLFILRSSDGAEIWFADRGNFHWFTAFCPTKRAWDSTVELLELLISDRCVVRYNDSPASEQPTAGETVGAAWSR